MFNWKGTVKTSVLHWYFHLGMRIRLERISFVLRILILGVQVVFDLCPVEGLLELKFCFFLGSSSRLLCKEWRGWLGRVMNYRGAEWCWGEAMCTSWWLTRPALLAQPPPIKSNRGGAWRNTSQGVEPAFVSLFQKNESICTPFQNFTDLIHESSVQ